MRKPRPIRQAVRQRYSLLSTHTHVRQMNAFEISEMTHVPTEERDRAIIPRAKVAVVAEIDEAEIR